MRKYGLRDILVVHVMVVCSQIKKKIISSVKQNPEPSTHFFSFDLICPLGMSVSYADEYEGSLEGDENDSLLPGKPSINQRRKGTVTSVEEDVSLLLKSRPVSEADIQLSPIRFVVGCLCVFVCVCVCELKKNKERKTNIVSGLRCCRGLWDSTPFPVPAHYILTLVQILDFICLFFDRSDKYGELTLLRLLTNIRKGVLFFVCTVSFTHRTPAPLCK
jgi:hypothetical protein